MSVKEIKIMYNKYITKEKKALDYLESMDPSQYTKEEEFKLMVRFNELIRALSVLQKRYKLITGNEMTEDEKFNGFE